MRSCVPAQTELHPDCVDEYMQVILDELPQAVGHVEMLAKRAHASGVCDGGSESTRKQSFCTFACADQHAYVAQLQRASRVGMHGSVLGVRTNFERWFDRETCLAFHEQHARSV